MKRFWALLLAMLLLLAAFAGCKTPDNPNPDNPNPDNPGIDDPVSDEPTSFVDDGNTYDSSTYLPIVKKPIELEAMLSDNGSQGNYAERTLWAEMEEKTGIKVNLRLVVNGEDGEAAQLVFVSRDYPDMSFRIDCPNWQNLIEEAAKVGDIVELDNNKLEKYAPNWYKTFQENPDIYRMSVHTDGKLYGLPNLEMQESAINLRDGMYVNGEWLDELGLEVPTTIDDFTEYLRAVKAAAGTGSIPANVVPLYVREWTNLGGWWSFLDMYGVYNGFNGDVVVDGTTVKTNYNDPNIRVPIKYLASLFQEGLASTSTFVAYGQYTTDIDEAGTSTKTWFIGSYFGFWNCDHEFLEYVAPLTFDDEVQPYVRDMGLQSRLLKDNFFIFTNCKSPIAALRLMDTYADPVGTLRMSRGELGYNYIKDDNGDYLLNEEWSIAEDWSVYGLYNYGPGFTDADTVAQLYSEDANDGFSREWAYHNIYKAYLPENMQQFPAAALAYLTPEEQAEVNTYYQALNGYVRRACYQWVTGATNLDDAWDKYLQKLEDYGINEYVALKQKAWDAYSAATVE